MRSVSSSSEDSSPRPTVSPPFKAPPKPVVGAPPTSQRVVALSKTRSRRLSLQREEQEQDAQGRQQERRQFRNLALETQAAVSQPLLQSEGRAAPVPTPGPATHSPELMALVEKVELFLRSSRASTLVLTLGAGLPGRIELERTGPGKLAITLERASSWTREQRRSVEAELLRQGLGVSRWGHRRP